MATILLKLNDVPALNDNLLLHSIVNKFKDLERENPISEGEYIIVNREHTKFEYITIWDISMKRWLAYPRVYTTEIYNESELSELDRVYSIQKINKLVDKDNLTGLLNKNTCMNLFEQEINRCAREDLGCSVILLDVDNFKQVNDSIGYIDGDNTLIKCSDVIKKVSRSYDILCRWGGDEFLLIYPNTGVDEVVIIGNRLRRDISGIMYKKGNNIICISASIAVMTINCREVKISSEFAFKYLDYLLKKSKMAGKNCIVMSNCLDSNKYIKYKELWYEKEKNNIII